MTVAARSISEWAASDRIAREPDKTPTTALATVSPAEATMDVSATCSFSLAMVFSGARPAKGPAHLPGRRQTRFVQHCRCETGRIHASGILRRARAQFGAIEALRYYAVRPIFV